MSICSSFINSTTIAQYTARSDQLKITSVATICACSLLSLPSLFALFMLVLALRSIVRRRKSRKALDARDNELRSAVKVTVESGGWCNETNFGLNQYQRVPSGESKVVHLKAKCPFYDDCHQSGTLPSLVNVEEYNEQNAGGEAYATAVLKDREYFSLCFKNLSLDVGEKRVLQPCSGVIEHGRLVAIMGPSGSGKSSFLAALTGRSRSYGQTSGEFLLKRVKSGKNQWHRISSVQDIDQYCGFVPQEDVMLRDMTVLENLTFSAQYRLPKGTDVDAVLQRTLGGLELDQIQHSFIGDEEKRGISGGERKRVNIGLEMVNDCAVLTADEPTSGLDAGSSIKCMALLKRLASNGACVLAVIHQPRREIFEMCDDVILPSLLARGGRLAYHGPREKMVNYFSAHFNAVPRIGQNPADFALDLLSDTVTHDLDSFRNEWVSHSQCRSSAMPKDSGVPLPKLGRTRQGFCSQFLLCARRAFVQIKHHIVGEITLFSILCIIGVVLGAMFPNVNINEIWYATFLVGLLLGLVSSIRSLSTFGAERTNFWRESSSGLNRLSYALSKIFVDLICSFWMPLAILLGFQCTARPLQPFGSLYVMLLGTTIYTSGLGYVLSLVASPHRAQLLTVCLIALCCVLSGVNPTKSDLSEKTSPGFATFLITLSYESHLTKSSFVSEMLAYKKSAEAAGCSVDDFSRLLDEECREVGVVQYFVGTETADTFGWTKEVERGTWAGGVGIMIGFGVFFRALAVLLIFAVNRAAQNRGRLLSCLTQKKAAALRVADDEEKKVAQYRPYKTRTTFGTYEMPARNEKSSIRRRTARSSSSRRDDSNEKLKKRRTIGSASSSGANTVDSGGAYKVCKACGRKRGASAVYCGFCGAKLGSSEE